MRRLCYLEASMAAWVAPLLGVAGIALYFLVSIRFAVYRRFPWEYLAVVAAALLLSAVELVRTPGPATAAAAAFCVALVAFAGWYFFSYSQYGGRETRPGPGEPFPDFSLPTSSGETFRLGAARGRRILLIFYRGDW